MIFCYRGYHAGVSLPPVLMCGEGHHSPAQLWECTTFKLLNRHHSFHALSSLSISHGCNCPFSKQILLFHLYHTLPHNIVIFLPTFHSCFSFEIYLGFTGYGLAHLQKTPWCELRSQLIKTLFWSSFYLPPGQSLKGRNNTWMSLCLNFGLFPSTKYLFNKLAHY